MTETGRGYVTTSWWYRFEPDQWEADRGLPGWEMEPLVSAHDTLDSAETQGQRDGCMNGIRRVEVRGPDGRLHALWDKESLTVTKTRRYLDARGRMLYDVERKKHLWQRISEESKDLNRRLNAELGATFGALRAELGRNPTSMEVVERLRARGGDTEEAAPDR